MKQTLTAAHPKLGFAGAGWIGKNRLDSLIRSGVAEPKGAVDPDPEVIHNLRREYPQVKIWSSFHEMLESDVEGIVIASPSALHADQALQALKHGKAVFCQKPLGRNGRETAAVVETARECNLLLGVDFSYRYSRAGEEVHKVIRSGELGRIFGVDLVFHNAWGPDKNWYRDPALSGGGCLMDLGIHLIDFLFDAFGNTRGEADIHKCSCQLFRKGCRLRGHRGGVEDYASLQFILNRETSVQLSCSWNLPAGRDAVIGMNFFGENGGVGFHNIEGSFYDFVAERYSGTSSELLASPPDNWGGRSINRWARKLSSGKRFDAETERYKTVADALDYFYKIAWQ